MDERWKAGAFRYLMPDFRARVHAGETFVIAGDRFAIGSSREMSPAGLKAIAEEVGLEMVIICANNMGDIFRRNALNLGLHVVQSPEAVADARDGDEFTFEPISRRITNVTQGKTYEPVRLTDKEDETPQERRHLCHRTPRVPLGDRTRAADRLARRRPRAAHVDDRTDHLGAPRRQGCRAQSPAPRCACTPTSCPASDGTAPFAIHTFNQITGGDAIYPRQAAVANDHFVFTGKEDDDKQTLIGHQFAEQHDIRKPYYATPGDGIFHFYFPEQGLVFPGQFIPGADSHSRAYGAYGAVGMGVGSTTLGFGWSTGYIYFTMTRQRRVRFTGRLRPWVTGKDIVLELLRRWGAKQSQGMSVELVDGDKQLPIAYRNTIANMMAEAEALNGIFAADDITYAWYRAKGITDLPYPRIACGEDAVFEIDEELALGEVTAMIAKPFSPGNAFPADEVARERITFDKAMIGSCTNGSYDDLLSAALVLVAARKQGLQQSGERVGRVPGIGRRQAAD